VDVNSAQVGGTFPGKEYYFGIKDEEYDELIRDLGE
jgi:hypothetical protein